MISELKHGTLIIGNPYSNASSDAFINKFVKIISQLSKKTYIISGRKNQNYKSIYWITVKLKSKNTLLGKIISQLLVQLKICLESYKLIRDINSVIILPTSMFLPLIFLKFMNINSAVFAAQKTDKMLIKLFMRLCFMFSDLIIVESYSVIESHNLLKYKNKIAIGNIYVDTDLFDINRSIPTGDFVVGYVGSLDERKGTENLINAFVNIYKKNNKIKLIIAGKGPLESFVTDAAEKYNNIEYRGLILDQDLPKFYNELSLFVLPSISEGIPNVLLEAMSCGTPVLASSVGGIPNLIKDNCNGFLMGNNSPECIEENIFRVINYPNTEKIIHNATCLITKKYSYKAALRRYETIINVLKSNEAIL